MSPPFAKELEKIGRKLVWWKARLNLVFGAALVLGGIWLFGLLDIWLRHGRGGRIAAWLVLVGLVAATVWIVRRALRYRYTTQGVAASVERAFPDLDNHLINYIQFATDSDENPFKQAYLQQGAPSWERINPKEMRDRKLHRRSWIALGVAALLVMLPGLIFGPAWPRALARTVNPFANLEPLSLTKIVAVDPGAITVLQGDPLVLTCTVKGLEGHEVFVEVDAHDARTTNTRLGKISTGKPERFSRRVPAVNTGFRYRFQAGDSSPSEWLAVNTRPPPALTDLELRITPADYTGLPPRTHTGWSTDLTIPQGARVELETICNTALSNATFAAVGVEPVPMSRGEDATYWSGELKVLDGQILTVQAEDVFGTRLEEQLTFTLGVDLPPSIEVTAPQGRTVLPPGENPRIAFRVTDDFGVDHVAVEKERIQSDGTRAWQEVERIETGGKKDFQFAWEGDAGARTGGSLAYRITARDICTFSSNATASLSVVFDSQSRIDAEKERDKLEAKAVAGINQVLELQKKNLAETTRLKGKAADAEPASWNELKERQDEIRRLTRELLGNPLKPLGGLTSTVKKLYLNEMKLTVDLLAGIPNTAPEGRFEQAESAEQLEIRILRQLASAELAVSKAKIDRRISGLSAMLARLVGGQGSALKETRTAGEAGGPVSPDLVDLQDNLALDLTEFKEACKRESVGVRASDEALADTLDSLAKDCEDQKIRNDMLLAAEKLDRGQVPDAIPHEEQSLAKLKALQARMDGVKLKMEGEEKETMEEALAFASQKLSRVKELHKRMLKEMEAIRGQEDKSTEEVELMEEAYEELVRNTKESLLEVPTDLHVFMDLNVANELVEDVFAVFQEVEQVEGSENWKEDKVLEEAYFKEEVLLEKMEEAEGKLDDMEMWLGDDPDKTKVTTESFDQEEMPEDGIALGALPAELEDLISDLLEEDEELEDAADDGAVNHAMSDIEAGHEVMEGNITTYGARGKSGNTRPDHKEQDGRSNVGRQGMSNGETAAGSGTINEGDNNIEERRTYDPTQSGQVDLDGEADTRATGGGKLGTGKADDLGMSGGVKRMDSTEEGSWEGMAALMAKRADAIYAKASMKNVRVDSLKEAAHHLRQSADAIADGNIGQVKELKRLAAGALQEARMDLLAGPSTAFEVEGASSLVDDVVEAGSDVAPAEYRDEVAEYYKKLNELL